MSHEAEKENQENEENEEKRMYVLFLQCKCKKKTYKMYDM